MRVAIVRSQSLDAAPFKLAETLSGLGHEVRIIVWDRVGNLSSSGSDRYEVRAYRHPQRAARFGMLRLLPLFWLYAVRDLFRRPVDVVIGCDLDAAPPALFARITGARFAYFIYDFYADNLAPTASASLRAALARWERWVARKARAVFIVDESRKSQLAPEVPSRLVVINNSPPDVGPVPDAARDGLAVFYAGYLERSRGLAELLEAILKVAGARITVVGSGPFEEHIRDLSRSNPEKIEFLGWLPYREVLNLSRQADVLFAMYDPAVSNNRLASPNKLFEAMMLGRPIIVNDETNAAEIVRAHDCGVVVAYGRSSDLERALLRLRSPEERNRLGRAGRRAYDTQYSWAIMTDRLKGTIEALAGEE